LSSYKYTTGNEALTFTTDELRALNLLYVENILVLLLKNQNTRQIAITIRNIIIKHV